MNTNTSPNKCTSKSANLRVDAIESMVATGEIAVPDEVRADFPRMAANFEAMGLPVEAFAAQCRDAKIGEGKD